MSAERKVFGRLQGMAETPPDLIEIQTKSYEDFLQADVPAAKRENKGLQAIFKEIFPVISQDARYSLDFVGYNLGEPKKSYLQALLDGETYARPLFATFRLNDAGEVREEEVFLGDMPMMTPDGAFVINGAERVIVSQLHRSSRSCTALPASRPSARSTRTASRSSPAASYPTAATGSR